MEKNFAEFESTQNQTTLKSIMNCKILIRYFWKSKIFCNRKQWDLLNQDHVFPEQSEKTEVDVRVTTRHKQDTRP